MPDDEHFGDFNEFEDDVVFGAFDKPDLPDLQTLLWKLVHEPIRGTGTVGRYDDDELEYIAQVLKAPCPVCGGTGQNGMDREGNPYECKTCKGRGR